MNQHRSSDPSRSWDRDAIAPTRPGQRSRLGEVIDHDQQVPRAVSGPVLWGSVLVGGVAVGLIVGAVALAVINSPSSLFSADGSSGGQTGQEPVGGTATIDNKVPFSADILHVPNGWVVRDGGADRPGVQCLSPVAEPGCVLQVWQAGPGVELNVNADGAGLVESGLCGADPLASRTLVDFSNPTVSGRRSDFRLWEWHCGGVNTVRSAQTVVNSAPGFVFYLTDANEANVAVLNQVTQHSRLPAQSGSLPLHDFGIVRSARSDDSGSGISISLDRLGADGSNVNPATYDYSFSVDALEQPGMDAAALQGQEVQLHTDGQQVVKVRTPQGD